MPLLYPKTEVRSYNERFEFSFIRDYSDGTDETITVSLDDETVTLDRLKRAFNRFIMSCGYVTSDDTL